VNESLFPFPDDSPLGRATRDPIAALALLAEAVSRREQEMENYVIAANAALGHARQHGLIRLPEGEPAEVADVLGKPGVPAPHELYAQTGGGQAYIDAMIEHGYVVKKGAASGAPDGEQEA
jgi:hypothetical protein